MDPNADDVQESTTEEALAADQAVADTASSPDATEGVSSSDTAPQDERSHVDEAVDEFLKKFGEPDDANADEKEGKAEEGEQDAPEGERKAESKPKDEQQTDRDDGDDEHRLSDDEFKALPDGARKRIGHLNARAKRAEKQLRDYESELEVVRDSHERLETLRTFSEQNGITNDDVTLAFGLMAKLRGGDFKGFLSDVTPLVEGARQAAGEAYAPDLQQRVDQGYLSEDDARELTKARAEAARARELAEKANTQARTVAEQQSRANENTAIVQAVAKREAELKGEDPDYAQKSEAIKLYVQQVMKAGGIPKSRDAAVQLVNDAYDFVSKHAATPRAEPPKPTAPRPTGASSTASSRGSPRPTNLKDALEQAAESYVPARI